MRNKNMQQKEIPLFKVYFPKLSRFRTMNWQKTKLRDQQSPGNVLIRVMMINHCSIVHHALAAGYAFLPDLRY